MKKKYLFQILFVIGGLIASVSIHSQTWEADLNKIGQSQSGGFDYQWKNFTSAEVGTRTWTFDYSGVRTIKHAPAVGVHPRIFFNPEDTSDIRIRLNTTINGKELNRKRHAFTTLLNLGYSGGTYSSSASYAKNSLGQTYVSNSGYWDMKPIYDTFAAGDTTGYTLVKLKNGGSTGAFSNMLSMEAFECLIYKNNYDPDTKMTYLARAKKLAKAMTAYAFAASCYGLSAVNYTKIGGMAFPIAYDLNYWAMTDGQRDTIRKAIAMIIPDDPRYGNTVEPYATLSNWTALNSFEIIPNLAIEGESGYKPTLTHEWAKVFYKFVSYGFYSSGCGWEGLGKNYMNTGYQIAMARRGYSMLGHPHMRAFGSNYLPALSQPFGYSFTGDDALGGSGTNVQLGKYKFSVIDAVGFKWAYPNDDGVDFMWRNYVGNIVSNQEVADYAGGVMDPCTTSYHDYFAVLQAYITDWTAVDFSAKAQIALKNLDFFETDRGQVIFRSDWSINALQTIFNVRQNLGGHTNADRNSFTLSSHGRIWVPLRSAPGSAYYDVSEAHSCLFVDDSAMIITNLEGNKLRQPAKLLSWSGSDKFSQATGDATYAYSWEWSWSALAAGKDNPLLGKVDAGKQAWTKVTENLNTFRVNQSSENFYSIPFYEFGAWNSPTGYRETIIKRPYNVMEKVYRTISMIRGTHPALLIVDDAKKDTKSHTYKWTMQLATDVVIESSTDKGNGMYDVVLKESSGNRKLLVRMLNQNDYVSGTVPAKIDTTWYTTGDGKSYKNYRLVCESKSISPDFKVLLFPHLAGESLPTTSWNTDKTNLNVSWSDQTSNLAFSVVNGLTHVSLLATDVTGLSSDKTELIVSPNPASKTIVLKDVTDSTITISDLSGREKMKFLSKNNDIDINVSTLPSACYILKITKGVSERQAKLLINN
ncbi:MAG: T9SS type A sorting domain-containing protein [Paludibacter sp.]